MIGSFGQRRRLFSIGKFPVYADLGAALLAVLILSYGSRTSGALGLIEAVLLLVIVFASVLLHELGHAVVVERLGYGRSSITLSGLGGVTAWRGRPSHRDQILVSFAGPAVSLALGGIGLLARPYVDGIAHTAASYVGVLNLFWGVFNLLPIYPMDGGKALRSALTAKMGRRGVKVSLMVSGGVGVALALAGVAYGSLIIALYLGWVVMRNWNEWQALEADAR